MRKLQGHFGQTNKDIEDILISAGKIEKRAGKIEELEFDGDEQQAPNSCPARHAQAGGGRVKVHMQVIPGRAEGAGPESSATIEGLAVPLWIPGSRASRAPRNDGEIA